MPNDQPVQATTPAPVVATEGVPRDPCWHGRIQWGSGGYYLMCVDCGRRWVHTGIGGPDVARAEGSMTPLATRQGRFMWLEGATNAR